jgi:uncharacterized protein (DUF362 family)
LADLWTPIFKQQSPMTNDSRRSFLRSLALGALAITGCGKSRDPGSAASAQPAAPESPTAPPAKSRVVIARDAKAMRENGEPDYPRVLALLTKAMLALTGAATSRDAWSRHFRPEDVVALKANSLAGPQLSTNPAVCYAIADGLHAAGVSEPNILVYDRDLQELEMLGFDPPPGAPKLNLTASSRAGYDREPTVIKEVGSCFSRIVSETATAIINVPVLKDHDLAGLSCALKNHYGSINNPNKLHTDHCYPYVADLNCAPVLREKQRLVVCDALRVCYDGGPAPNPAGTVPYGALIVTTDAVAADAVGLEIIEALRKEHGLPPLMQEERAPRFIALAADYGLGNAAAEKIEEIAV